MAGIDRLNDRICVKPAKLAALRLRQRDGVTCGPTVAVVAGAMLDHTYRAELLHADGAAWFAAEQGRIHAAVNRIWPRQLGTTPAGMARALSDHSAKRGVTYRWRRFRGTGDTLSDVRSAAVAGWPVAMLIGERGIPRHWVLVVGAADEDHDVLECYEPSSGKVLPVDRRRCAERSADRAGISAAVRFVVPDQAALTGCLMNSAERLPSEDGPESTRPPTPWVSRNSWTSCVRGTTWC